MSNNWCGNSVKGPSRRRLLSDSADDAVMARNTTAGNGTDVADEEFVAQFLGVESISVNLALHMKNLGENGMNFSVTARPYKSQPICLSASFNLILIHSI